MLPGIVMAQERAPSVSEKREVEKAWEALIRAKGGRERLHSVTNMIIEEPGVTDLYVFPNSQWHFAPFSDKWGKPIPALSVWAGSLWYVCNAGGIVSAETYDNSNRDDVYEATYLLETKWTKPELLRVERIRKDKNQLDVIETKVGEKRVDFVFESEELLVYEVWWYYKGVVSQKYRFSDYTEINGIKVPRKIAWSLNDFKFKGLDDPGDLKIMLNVDYDPEIFTHPTKATTADAWKRKAKQ